MNTQERSAVSLSLSKYGLDRIQLNLLTNNSQMSESAIASLLLPC